MDVFYVAFQEDSELKIEAFNHKHDLNERVGKLKANHTRHKVVKLQNNNAIKGFIDFVTDYGLSEAFHQMMQKDKK